MCSYFGKPDVQRRANLNNKENDKGRIVFPLGTMPDMRGVCPQFCVNTAGQCKIEQKYFKAGAAPAAAALPTK